MNWICFDVFSGEFDLFGCMSGEPDLFGCMTGEYVFFKNVIVRMLMGQVAKTAHYFEYCTFYFQL